MSYFLILCMSVLSYGTVYGVQFIMAEPVLHGPKTVYHGMVMPVVSIDLCFVFGVHFVLSARHFIQDIYSSKYLLVAFW